MKLHRNAALSWNGRRRLVWRVIEQGWTITAAAGAAGVSMRCARKWIGRYRSEGEAGLRDRSSAPHQVANRTDHERVQAILALRRLRFTAAEIAETLSMALSTVSGILTREGMGQLEATRARAGDPLRALTPGRARAHRHQEARPDPGRRRLACPRRCAALATPAFTDRNGKVRNTVGYEYVHIAVDDYSRPRLRRGTHRREGRHRRALPRTSSSILPALRHPSRTRDH